MTITQENRTLQITTPLDGNLLLTSVRAREKLSAPFTFEIEMLSEDAELDFDAVLGQPVSVLLKTYQGERFLHGIVNAFTQTGTIGGLAQYEAEVVPWLWLLTRTSDCRIFQKKSVPDIVSMVFDELGFSDYRWELEGSFDEKVYCVQYRETHFNFVSRLLQEEGIHYFFEHERDSHVLVLADAPSANQPCREQETARFNAEGTALPGDGYVLSFVREESVVPNKVRLTDYNFETPLADLAGEREAANGTVWEIYDHPGRHLDATGGERLAGIRLEEHTAAKVVVHGQSTCRAFVPGFRFDLEGHPRSSWNASYLLTEVVHEASEEAGYVAGGRGQGEVAYRNRFTAIPHEVPFRPPYSARKPVIGGSQTAVVVGPAGEEIYTDKYGRVKVQFHWDRLGANDENSSCWIRVSHHWAGKNWGTFFVPRIGQEVIIDFLDGDPDRPIITGRVYNAEQMPPYSLPGKMTQTTIKTRSSKGGSPANFNEIRFEDKAGSEELYIHAEKDKTVTVENDRNESVGNDETISIGNDRGETVGNDETITIGNDRSSTIGTDKSETVGSNKTVTVGADLTESIGANETLTVSGSRTRSVSGSETATISMTRTKTVGVNEMMNVGGAQEVSVGGLQAVTVGAAQTVNVGAVQSISVGANRSVSVGGSESVKVGATQTIDAGADRKVDVGGTQQTNVKKDCGLTASKKIVVNAGEELLIQVGKAKIAMKKNGDIEISGKKITIKGSGDIKMKGSKIMQN